MLPPPTPIYQHFVNFKIKSKVHLTSFYFVTLLNVVIHFLGSAKPWTSQQSPAGPFNQFWNMWWDIYKNNEPSAFATSGYRTPVSEQKVEYVPKSAPPPTKSAPSVGSIEDILTHIDKQLSADDEPSEK